MDFQDGLHICPISRLSFSYSVFKVRSWVKPRFQHLNLKCWNLHLTYFAYLKAVVGQSGLEFIGRLYYAALRETVRSLTRQLCANFSSKNSGGPKWTRIYW